MIRFFDYSPRSHRLSYQEGFPEDFAFKKTHLYWIDIEAPTNFEAHLLATEFQFDPLSIEDSLDQNHHPKVEEFEEYILIILHTLSLNTKEGTIATPSISLFVGTNFLVTVHHDPIPLLERMIRRTQKSEKLSDTSILHFAHKLLSQVTDSFLPVGNYFEKKNTRLENEILAGSQKTSINNIVEYKREINGFLGLIKDQTEVFEEMVEEEFEFIPEDEVKYFQDLYEEMDHIVSMIDKSRITINSVLDLYVSLNTDKLNEIVKVLTMLSGIMLPLTLITGFYGMNFSYLPGAEHQYGFIGTLVGMGIITVLLIGFFRYKRWF